YRPFPGKDVRRSDLLLAQIVLPALPADQFLILPSRIAPSTFSPFQNRKRIQTIMPVQSYKQFVNDRVRVYIKNLTGQLLATFTVSCVSNRVLIIFYKKLVNNLTTFVLNYSMI